MIASIAAHDSPKLIQDALPARRENVRAVAPTPAAPVSNDRPPQPPAWHWEPTVALAPAAMSALIQAQAHMSGGSEFDREKSAQQLDRMIASLDDSNPPPPPTADAPFIVRRLQAALELLV